MYLKIHGIVQAQSNIRSDRPVTAVAFSTDNLPVAPALGNCTIRLWDRRQHTLEGHENLVRAIAFLPNGQLAASGSYNHTARLWSISLQL